jgi:DNA polymerase-3 subunit alpha
MENREFTQLHLHTYFSILDGVPSPEEYVEKAKSLGMKSLAITDHGTMSGVLRFNNACVEAGIKPIIGCEFYVNYNRELKESGSNFHLVLLAKNETGYKNLLKINHDAMENGFYYRGRASEEFIFKNSEGIICMTACLGSVFSKLILDDKIQNVKNKLRQYKKVFGKDFYIELQFNETEDQLKVTKILNELSKDLDIKTVVTGDCHYINKGDEEIQSVQLMVNTKKTMSDENVFRFSVRSLYFHTPVDYMEFNRNLKYCIPLKELVRSMKNTQEIANKCNYKIEKSDSKFPRFIDKDGFEVNADLLLKKKIKIGAKKIFPNGLTNEYKKRIRKEVDVVSSKGFSDYFLIIEDIIKFCKKEDIAVGAGRGSAAGSLISFLLGITKIDPIKYDLLFERFLNKDRKDPPDIDLDFESLRKPEIEKYLRSKYGNDRVAHIITFSTFRLKGAVRDVARVYEKDKDEEFKSLIKKFPDEPIYDLKEISLYNQIK